MFGLCNVRAVSEISFRCRMFQVDENLYLVSMNSQLAKCLSLALERNFFIEIYKRAPVSSTIFG